MHRKKMNTYFVTIIAVSTACMIFAVYSNFIVLHFQMLSFQQDVS